MPLSPCLYWGENMSNYLDRFKMASCPLEVRWFLDSKPDRNIPLWSQIWKGNMLQNTQLQRNGRQSPKSDEDMNDLCVKIRQNGAGSLFCGANLQISRLLRQKIMMYCRINLQTSKALRNTNQFLSGSKMGKSCGTGTWFSLASRTTTKTSKHSVFFNANHGLWGLSRHLESRG